MFCPATQADIICLFSNELIMLFFAPSSLLQTWLRAWHIVGTQCKAAELNENSPHPPAFSVACCKITSRRISGQLLFWERVVWGVEPWLLDVGSRQRASGVMAPFLPVLIICLVIGGIRQQQLSHMVYFQNSKLLGEKIQLCFIQSLKKEQQNKSSGFQTAFQT